MLGLMLALVFEDSHHPGNIVQMFYDQGGIKLAQNTPQGKKECFRLQYFQRGSKTLGVFV